MCIHTHINSFPESYSPRPPNHSTNHQIFFGYNIYAWTICWICQPGARYCMYNDNIWNSCRNDVSKSSVASMNVSDVVSFFPQKHVHTSRIETVGYSHNSIELASACNSFFLPLHGWMILKMLNGLISNKGFCGRESAMDRFQLPVATNKLIGSWPFAVARLQLPWIITERQPSVLLMLISALIRSQL